MSVNQDKCDMNVVMQGKKLSVGKQGLAREWLWVVFSHIKSNDYCTISGKKYLFSSGNRNKKGLTLLYKSWTFTGNIELLY